MIHPIASEIHFRSSSQLPRFPKAVHHRWQNSPSIYLTETAGAPCGFSYPFLGGRSYTLPRRITFEALGPCLQPVTPGRRGPWVKPANQRSSRKERPFHGPKFLRKPHMYKWIFIWPQNMCTFTSSSWKKHCSPLPKNFSKYRNLPMF